MSAEANKVLVQAWIETGLRVGDWDRIEDFFSPSYASPWFHGITALKRSLKDMRAAFPDLQIVVEELIAEDDRVVARCTYAGTHRGSFQRRAPTGRLLRWEGVTIYRIRDGKIVAEWAIWDQTFIPKLDGDMES
jgi:steroid delta-isomerase-like uncharacterized protein